MKYRQFTHDDYNTVVSWWKHYGEWAFLPLSYLPETSYVIVGENDDLLAFASLYVTNSPFAVLEWITANPSSDKETKTQALNLLLSNIKNDAMERGCKMLHTSTRIQSLVERLKNEHGFFDHDHSLTALFSPLNIEEVAKDL